MFRLFIGMILGSLTTLMLLGGQPAANRMLGNLQHLADGYAASGLSLGWLALLMVVWFGLSCAAAWRTKAMSLVSSTVGRVRRSRPLSTQ